MDIGGPAAVTPPAATQPGSNTAASGAEELSDAQKEQIFGELLLSGAVTSAIMISGQMQRIIGESRDVVEG